MLVTVETLDLNDSRPSYQQVADGLRDAIRNGKLQAGDQLPTHRALAEEYGVASETAKRALRELRTEGLIVTRQGKGSYVRSAAEHADTRSQTGDLAEVVAELRSELDAVKRRLDRLEAGSSD